MTPPLTIKSRVQFKKNTPRGQQALEVRKPAKLIPSERIPRIAKLLALAHRFEELIRTGYAEDYAQLADLGGVTRARITQVMNCLLLAPDVQEEILFLTVTEGRDPIILRDLQAIAAEPNWKKQRVLWKQLKSQRGLK